MRHITIVLLFFFSFTAARASFSQGIENRYGNFVETKVRDDYLMTFVLNPANKEFSEIQEVSIFDYGNDEEGDISTVLHRNGDTEVFFRTKRNYRRYISQNPSADVCREEWSAKIQYRQSTRKWECPGLNFIVNFFMWDEIDSGLADAKRGDLDALFERIMDNVKKIIK